jgi:preprotein translocase subunit SecA
MAGRRYSEGLHQALEAKEKVEIQRENQTLASITFQNLFRMYPKLAGMTGTAMTEAAEFGEIYRLEVVEIPTNVAVARLDHDDEIYRTMADKSRAIVKLVKECRERQQPMLVGTVSIEKSEALSDELKKEKIPHNVLNARYHEQEAYIIAQAGRPGGVTIATNMAGRGTDIQLGGNVDMMVRQSEAELIAKMPDEAQRTAEIERRAAEIREQVARDREIVRQAGGLYVVGTERHESRRIDNQLRGRAGRQGDPGASKFFLSLEDDLMRIFGNNKVLDWVQKKGMADDEALTHRWLNKALETAQGKVEARNFEIRKNLLRFDDVMNSQRKEIYKERIELMATDDVSEVVAGMRRDVIDGLVSRHIPEGVYAEQWKTAELKEEIKRIFALDLPVDDWAKEEGIAEEEIKTRLNDAADRLFAQKVAQYGPDIWHQVEKSVLMQLFDQSWKDHLLHLDHLRQGIGLRAYGQKDPLNEYKREAFNLFSDLLSGLREQVVNVLATLQLRLEAPPMPAPAPQAQMREVHEDPALAAAMASEPGFDPADPTGGGVATLARPRTNPKVDPNDPATWGKVSRNAPCPCGSGKKFKHCHGRV